MAIVITQIIVFCKHAIVFLLQILACNIAALLLRLSIIKTIHTQASKSAFHPEGNPSISGYWEGRI